MNYAFEILNEQRDLLRDEIRFAKGLELEKLKSKIKDVDEALLSLQKPITKFYCKDESYHKIDRCSTQCPDCIEFTKGFKK